MEKGGIINSTKRLSRNFRLIIFLFAVFSVIASIAYSSFREQLNIVGTAQTVLDDSPELLNSPILVSDSPGQYFSVNFNLNSVKLTLNSETWVDDTYHLKFIKGKSNSKIEDMYFTISFSNPTVLQYTNGSAVSVALNNIPSVASHSVTINKTVLQPGEICTVVFNVKAGWANFGPEDSLEAIISFDVYDITKKFYFILDF